MRFFYTPDEVEIRYENHLIGVMFGSTQAYYDGKVLVFPMFDFLWNDSSGD